MEKLKELFGEELYTQIVEKLNGQLLFLHNKDKKVIIDDGSLVKKDGMIPKDRFDQANDQVKSLKKQAEDLTKEIGTLKKSAEGNEELTTKITDLETKLADSKTTFEKESVNTTKRFALRDALRDNEARPEYVDMLQTQIPLDHLVIGDDGKIKSVKASDTDIKPLEEVMKSIKETYPDSFGTVTRKGAKIKDGNDPNAEYYTEDEIKAMSQAEVNENIDKVNKSMEYNAKQTE